MSAAAQTSAPDLARVAWAQRAKWVALALLLVVLVAFPFMVSTFGVNIATQALIFGLFALSINMLAGFGGMVTLGHAGLLGVAGYGVAILSTKSGWSLGTSIAGGLAVCVVASAFFGVLVARVRGTYFVMVTLAVGMVIWGLAQRWQELTGGENGLGDVPRPSFTTEYWHYYYLTLAVVLVGTVILRRILYAPFGLTLRGVRDAEDRLAPLGFNVAVHKLVAFTISGFFAGVAGVLLAMYNNFIGPSDVFFLASAEGLLMSILGGVSTVSGAYVGATIVVIIQNWVSSYVARWQTLLGLVFVLVVLFAPDGLVGAWNRLVWNPLLRRFRAQAGQPQVAPSTAGMTPVGGKAVAATSADTGAPETSGQDPSEETQPSGGQRAGTT